MFNSSPLTAAQSAEEVKTPGLAGAAQAAGDGGARPRHVAIIMDGNGRWAKARGLPRLAGHRRGAETVRRIVEAAPDLGVEWLTLYAFSTENWKRSAEEVTGLMELFAIYIRREGRELKRRGARVRFIGERGRLAPDLAAAMARLEADTAQNDKLNLTIAINYGGRDEIAAAARRLAEDVAAGRLDPACVDAAALEARLNTCGFPDPDLVIRTSGEMRTSNFLPWQTAYSEFAFVDDFWPDFTVERFGEALASFGARQRRFGAVG
ncbi:polyprenyl diphosphate synthase [Albimonas sp. CAU 1670]|uniref:polyprenyl diphosphate synthase n=1 Tax=Albimonas sp. CAU 1670 TaxID=3032599 RepID=UPI0023DA24F9|nr:polyprenyl diphosphate synthase [Albimonas sp. CAU 1670]MDF2235473.1 polyprenyl diphosphate synthase [Albimonas sp. CAU 1670]